MDKISYALGVSLGNNLKNSGFEGLDYQKLADGIKHVIQKEKLEMSIQEAQAIINDYFQQLQEKAFEQNIKEGKNFLAENAKRAEVKTTASGLQYEIIKEGKGQTPAASDRVKVHYHGTLIDGTVFDSSVDRGEPAVFGVNQVIKGWTEALKLMPVGSKYKLYIPQELAYGSQSMGNIKPFSALIFEVELIGIEK